MPAQPVRHAATATSTSAGAITFTFPQVPAGLTWTGTVAVASAPISAIFTAAVADVGWGTWAGPQSSQQLQAYDRLALVVTGAGLLPAKEYTATFVATSEETDAAALVYPSQSLAVAPFSSLQIIDATKTLGVGGSASFPPGGGAFDVRGWAGLRLGVVTSVALVELQLQWQSASGGGLGTRELLVSASLNATLPNLGDFLTVDLLNFAAAPQTAQLLASLVSSPSQAWAINADIGLGFDALLLYIENQAIAGGATFTSTSTSTTFAGQVTANINMSAVTTWTARLQWQDVALAWHNLYVWTQASVVGGLVLATVLVPPTPLRFNITNNDAGAHNVTASLVADLYRSA